MLVLPAAPSRADCGVERWATKTLKDPSATKIDFKPVHASISILRAQTAPANLRKVNPDARFATETKVYSFPALLVGFKKESDGDYHFVIADPQKPKLTMIAEIPDPSCANPKYSGAFETERHWAESQHTVSAKYYKFPKPIPVVVIGVNFFDFIHGQTGVAPNGVELHPLLSIK